MKFMKPTTAIICISVLLIVLGGVSTASAQDPVYGQPGDWLTSYQTARTAGMGGSFVANADGALGSLWNPAGLSHLLQNQTQFETVSLFGESRMNAFSFALPGQTFPSVGISFVTLNSGDFERTNELNDHLGTFSAGNLGVYLTAAKRVSEKVSMGANFKMVRESLEDFNGGGVGLDLGLMADITREWKAGASILNIGGPKVTYREADESYPVNFRGGLAWNGMKGRALVTAQVDAQKGPGAIFSTGAEFWVHRVLALRAGYRDHRVAGGLSVRVSHNMRLDYSAQDNELDVLHRVGIVYDFGGFHATSQATPEIFSPSGENSVTTFHLKTRTRGEAVEWSLDIIDKDDQLVRRFGGKGNPPALVLWDGTDESGMPLPDGSYRYRFSVTDDEGVEISAKEQSVEISTSGPSGKIPVEVN